MWDQDEELGKPYDLELLKRFYAYVRPHRGTVALTVVTILLGIAAEITPSFLLRSAIDGPIQNQDSAGLWIYAGAFLVLALISGT